MVTLVGGTDKMSSAVPVGLYRTYARLDEEFGYEAWCRAARSGRTFLSGGPLVTLAGLPRLRRRLDDDRPRRHPL
jgi:hypothetical protein